MSVSQELRDLIVKHHNKGSSVRKIAQLLTLPKSTVHNIVRRYVEEGETHTQGIMEGVEGLVVLQDVMRDVYQEPVWRIR
jgi:transposase